MKQVKIGFRDITIASEEDFLEWFNFQRRVPLMRLENAGLSIGTINELLSEPTKLKSILALQAAHVDGKQIRITKEVVTAFEVLATMAEIELIVSGRKSVHSYELVVLSQQLQQDRETLFDASRVQLNLSRHMSNRGMRQTGLAKSVTTRAVLAIMEADGEDITAEQIMNILERAGGSILRGDYRYEIAIGTELGTFRISDRETDESKQVSMAAVHKSLSRERRKRH